MNIKCMSSVPSLSLHSLLHGINDCERYINGVDPAKAGRVEKGGRRWQGNGHRNRDKETPTGSRGIILAAVPGPSALHPLRWTRLTSQPGDEAAPPTGQLRTCLHLAREMGMASVARRRLGEEGVTGWWEKKKTKNTLP